MKKYIFLLVQAMGIVLPGFNQVVGARLEPVARNIYAIIHQDATDEWPHGNTGVIIGDREVLVIDACYLPSMAREDIRLIRSITKKPIRYLVITHWHFDHNNGMIAYRDSFPDIQMITEKESRKLIELNSTWWSRRAASPGSSKRVSLEELEARMAAGKDTSGRSFSQEEIKQLTTIIEQRKNELAELTNLKVIPANNIFSGRKEIDLGNRKVQIVDRGNANSPHDVTVYVPDAQVLFTGDILVQTPLPYLGASWPLPWVEVLKQLEKMPIKAMVLGHGPVQKDHAYTRLFREFLEQLLKKEEVLIREGKTLEQAQELINMDEFKKGPWKNDSPAFLTDWDFNLKTIIERAWRGIRGQG